VPPLSTSSTGRVTRNTRRLRRAFHLDLARERRDQVLDDGQPEADAAGTAIRAAIDLKEGNEDLVEVAWAMPGRSRLTWICSVALGNCDGLEELRWNAKLDEACACELQGIGDEVVDDLEQLDLVDQHLRFTGGRQVEARAELDSLGRRRSAVQVDGDADRPPRHRSPSD
jgi:hypothetical protein